MSQTSVKPILKSDGFVCLMVVVGVVTMSQLIPFMVKDKTNVDLEDTVLEDDLFESFLRISIVLSIASFLDVFQDYLSTFSHQVDFQVVNQHRFFLITTFFIPNVIMLLFCIRPVRIELYLALKQMQVIFLGFPTVLLLNYYDIDIWTNNRVYYIMFMNLLNRVCLVLYYISGNKLFQTLGIVFRVLMFPVGLPSILRWFYCHVSVIRDVIILRPSIGGKYGNARSLSVFYILVVFITVMGAFFASLVWPDTGKSANGGRMVVILETIAIALIALIPGRLARRDLVQSDVRKLTQIPVISPTAH